MENIEADFAENSFSLRIRLVFGQNFEEKSNRQINFDSETTTLYRLEKELIKACQLVVNFSSFKCRNIRHFYVREGKIADDGSVGKMLMKDGEYDCHFVSINQRNQHLCDVYLFQA